MKQHGSKVWKKFATTVVVGLTSAVLLTVYGSGDEGNNTGDETGRDSATKVTKTDGSTPAASEDRLLLTNEVQRADLSGNKIIGLKDVMEAFLEDSMKFGPAECATFTNLTEELENTVGAYTDIKEENAVVSVSVLKNPEVYQKYEDSLEKCSGVTATMSVSDILKDSTKSQEISPEMQDMFNDMDMMTTMKLHREKWKPNFSAKPVEFTVHETSANINAGGTNITTASYDVVGIVNGVMVMVFTAPTPDVPIGNMEDTTDPTQVPEATLESKEAARKHTLDVFGAQVKRIMDAIWFFFLAYCFLKPQFLQDSGTQSLRDSDIQVLESP